MLKTIIALAVATALSAATLIVLSTSTPDASPAGTRVREAALEHEHLIADCMRQRGFEYVAVVPADVLLEEARAAAEARGRDPVEAVESLDLPPNPNKAIAQRLSPARAEAHADAYWGEHGSDGCYYATYEDAWGVDILSLGSTLERGLPEAEQKIANDERVIEAKADFVKCMADGGYEFASVDEIMSYPARQEVEVVDRINGADGGSDVRTDDPVWQSHKAAMAEFDGVLDGCEAVYRDIIVPIENQYLSEIATPSTP